jgi:hypothetical protein
MEAGYRRLIVYKGAYYSDVLGPVPGENTSSRMRQMGYSAVM